MANYIRSLNQRFSNTPKHTFIKNFPNPTFSKSIFLFHGRSLNTLLKSIPGHFSRNKSLCLQAMKL